MYSVVTLVMMYALAIYCQDHPYNASFKSPDGDFELEWSNNYSEESITMQVCKHGMDEDSTTLVGIGFSDHGENENADVLIVDLLALKAQDMHTNSEGQLLSDASSDYAILDISVMSDRACFTFKRKWDTCDPNDYLIDRGTTNILLFTSVDFWSDLEELSLVDMHPMVEFLQLIRSTIAVNKVDKTTAQVDIVVGMNEISNADTTYWCKVIRLPDFPTKNHIIRYEAIISEGSRGLVHHMELFHCNEAPSPHLRDYNAPCNSETKPMGLTMCRKVIAAWAMGAGPFTFPDDVGNPIGGSDYVHYAILEIHYNNPEKLSGIIDNSGMRLYYTPQLRTFDSGIIELGLEYDSKNSIPPQQKQFTLSGYCVAQCLSEALPETGIFIFGSQLHTHLTGIKVETRHFRGNRELAPLNIDEHYQPHYQEIRLLPEIVNILPGDSLVTSCTYKTTNRTTMTLGGIAITDEMCLNYVFYYPRIDFELCKSSVSDVALKQFLGSSLTNLRETFNGIVWTSENVESLSDLYYTAPIHQSCNMSDSRSYPGDWDFIEPVQMERKPFRREKVSCPSGNY